MTVREEVRERIERDPQLVKLRKKIGSGKASYTDTAAYSVRAGKLLGEIFSRRLPDIPLEEREALCVELLRDRYTDINALCDRVQKALDEAQGLHLAPQHAPFNGERAHQIGSSLRDLSKPVEVLQRRAKAAPETAVKAMHDDRMKTEAKFRSRAGLKCYITREAVSGCCAWCSKVAGRYTYGEEPDDIYHRHDKCDCTLTFENGRQRQDVWSKREWEAPEPGAGAREPVRFTKEQSGKILTIRELYGTIKAGDIQDKFKQYVPTRSERIEIIRKGISAEKPIFDSGSLAYYYQFVQREEGFYDVVMHGQPDCVGFYGRPIDYQTLAAIIMGRSDYKRGTPIRLFSCSTGKGEDSFAENLSRVMGVLVKAPDQDIHISFPLNGKSDYHIQSKKFARDGDWVYYKNGRRIEP